ncbi:MAG: metallophosphoesterase family protein [Methanophagales archaeon]|nr:metallophosphoesterase family protein [Methanophagales archaeon]
MDEVILTSDWHITNKKDAKHVLSCIPKGSSLLLLGDLIDAGIDRGMNWKQENLTVQLKALKWLLNHYHILGYVLGNHEMRIQKKIGLNPYTTIMGELETTELGLSGRSIAIEHGSSNAQNALKQLTDLAFIKPNADVVALGHNHTLGVFVHRGSNKVQWLVRTGHLMNGYAEYARKGIMHPKPAGYIRYSFDSNYPEVVLV